MRGLLIITARRIQLYKCGICHNSSVCPIVSLVSVFNTAEQIELVFKTKAVLSYKKFGSVKHGHAHCTLPSLMVLFPVTLPQTLKF